MSSAKPIITEEEEEDQESLLDTMLSWVVQSMNEAEKQGGSGAQKRERVLESVDLLIESSAARNETKDNLRTLIPVAIETAVKVRRFGQEFVKRANQNGGCFGMFRYK